MYNPQLTFNVVETLVFSGETPNLHTQWENDLFLMENFTKSGLNGNELSELNR